MKLLLYARSIFSSLAFIIITLGLSLSAIFFSVFTTSKTIPRKHIKLWGIWTCWLFGVEVSVKGKELWRRDRGGVVLFNHTSFFDIFAMLAHLPDMRFGAKIELFKIPVFGYAMRRTGILPIDRDRKEKVFAVYQQAVDRLKNGEKIALAPEGKRTTDPKNLASFKSGPFIFAQQSGVDLIPVVIKGAYDVYPKGQIFPATKSWKNPIELTVLEAVKSDAEKAELQNLIRSRMQAELSL